MLAANEQKKLHYEHPGNNGGISQAAEHRKELRQSLHPFWVKEDDACRQPRDKVCMCPGQSWVHKPSTQQAGDLGGLAQQTFLVWDPGQRRTGAKACSSMLTTRGTCASESMSCGF